MKKKKAVLICTCMISFWWNLSVFLTNYVDYITTVDNKFLYMLCVILAQDWDSETLGVMRLYLIPILFMIFACVSAIRLRRVFSKTELTAYLLPVLLAGIPSLAHSIFISAQWYPFGILPDITAYVGVLYLVWLIICITLLILSKRKQQTVR